MAQRDDKITPWQTSREVRLILPTTLAQLETKMLLGSVERIQTFKTLWFDTLTVCPLAAHSNKLIRQYIPKGTNINTITDTLITKIQKSIEDQEINSIFQRQLKNSSNIILNIALAC